jgi:hypothetical protein
VLESQVQEARRLDEETESLKGELAKQRARTAQINRNNAMLTHQMAEHQIARRPRPAGI